MNKRNGKVNLAKSTVNSFFNEFSEKPGAINDITNGANISSNITKKNKKIINIENIFEKNWSASIFPIFSLTPLTTGIKAEFIDPSANNRLNKFGSLNAIKKQSEIRLAPITFAINKSLKYPKTLERRVSELIIEITLINIF